MGTEDDLQQLCLETLRQSKEIPEEILIDKQVPIIKDCTFVPEDGGFTLYFGHIKGDIVLYRRLETAEEGFSESEFFQPWWQNSDDTLNIPYAVIEVKRGDSATTGAIRSKNEDAREIRSIFPFVGYFFVADDVGIQPHKFYRANKRFDGAFITDETAKTDWVEDTLIHNGIKPHISQLEGTNVLRSNTDE